MILDDGLNLTFPDYMVSMPPDIKKAGIKALPFGHSVAVGLDPKTGRTTGSEYGRYSDYGNAVRVPFPNVSPAANGEYYTNEEIEHISRMLGNHYIQRHPKAGKSIHYSHYPDVPYQTIYNKMRKAERSRFPQSYGFFYDGHNCGTYANDISQGESALNGRYHLPLTPRLTSIIGNITNTIGKLFDVPGAVHTGSAFNPIYYPNR